MRIFASTRSRTTLTLAATLLAVTGCGAATTPVADDTASQVTLVDGWIKSIDGPTAVEDGFVIEADGEFTMEPGGDHVMLMDLAASLEPGQDIDVELVFADDSTMTVTVPAKDFSGAEENYGHDDHGGSS